MVSRFLCKVGVVAEERVLLVTEGNTVLQTLRKSSPPAMVPVWGFPPGLASD